MVRARLDWSGRERLCFREVATPNPKMTSAASTAYKADPHVQFVFGQPVLHERGFQQLDYPLAVGMGCAESTLPPALCDCSLISRPCHHGASPPDAMRRSVTLLPSAGDARGD